MIRDSDFKKLKHNFKDFNMFKNGQELEPGYKPDYVLKKGNHYIILESETTSSRKTYVGSMMKAAHFLQHENKGDMIFVIDPKENTKVESIASHLKLYLRWIKKETNLRNVYVIEAAKYYSNDALLILHGKKFKKCAIKV